MKVKDLGDFRGGLEVCSFWKWIRLLELVSKVFVSCFEV